MSKSDVETVQEIEASLRQGLAFMASGAHSKILKLEDIDRDKAWKEVTSAVDEYGEDMIDDIMQWLRSRHWQAVVDAQVQSTDHLREE